MTMISLFKVRMADEAAPAVAKVLASGYIGQGPRCEEFERAFGEMLGAPEPPLLLNSCTSAIDLALHLIGVGPGDEVISTPITCTATNSPPVTRGARIIWADCDPLTGNIDPGDVARKVTSKTKAIIGVNWAGRLCDYEALRGFSVPVIEDAAHGPFSLSGSHGGDYACWSFQAIKHLTTGDGGALLVPPSQYKRAKLLRWYGLSRDSGQDFRCAQDITEVGYKYQSTDINAAIGLANLPGLEWSVAQSRNNAAYYHRAFQKVPGITLAPLDPGASYWIFTILVEDRDQFIEHLKERGIAASQVHARNDRHTAFKAASESRGPLPGVDYFDAHQVSIPNGWWLSNEQREYVANVVIDWACSRMKVAV